MPDRQADAVDAAEITTEAGASEATVERRTAKPPTTPEPSRIALLLIHGMGEQEPYELTDTFAVHLTDAYGRCGRSVKLAHHVLAMEGHAAPESYVELKLGNKEAKERGGSSALTTLDIHEAYWADKPQGLIKLKEVGRWLLATSLAPLKRWSQHASSFYHPPVDEPDEAPKFEPVDPAGPGTFLREVLLTLLLPLTGLLLLMFTLNAVGVVDSYTDGVRADLQELQSQWTNYLLLALFVVTAASALFMALGAWRIRQKMVYEKLRLGAEHNEANHLRWGFLTGWAWGSVVTSVVLGGVAALLYQPKELRDLLVIVLRLEHGDPPITEPPYRVILVALGAVIGVLIVGRLIQWAWDNVPWRGFFRTIRVVLALLLVAGPIGGGIWAYYSTVPKDWRQSVLLVSSLGAVLAAWKLSSFLVSNLGDVAIYFGGLDNRSKYHAVREDILADTTKRLAGLLERKVGKKPSETFERCKDPRRPYYDEVFVAAHSLGSVVAYDTISRLATEQRTHADGDEYKLCKDDFDRLRGFFSFGSPLDKVVYFFHRTGSEKQPVRAQILNSLVALRRHHSGRPYGRYKFEKYQVPPKPVAEFRWYNAWSWGDILGHRLDFYRIDENKQFHFDYVPLKSHTAYWEDCKFYNEVRDWITPQCVGSPQSAAPDPDA